MKVNTGIDNRMTGSGTTGVEQYVVQTSTSLAVESNEVRTSQNAIGTEQKLIEAIEKANYVENDTTECQFSVHESTKQIMIKLVDKTTHKVVKEIPSEKILDMVANMCELAGLFIDEKR